MSYTCATVERSFWLNKSNGSMQHREVNHVDPDIFLLEMFSGWRVKVQNGNYRKMSGFIVKGLYTVMLNVYECWLKLCFRNSGHSTSPYLSSSPPTSPSTTCMRYLINYKISNGFFVEQNFIIIKTGHWHEGKYCGGS